MGSRSTWQYATCDASDITASAMPVKGTVIRRMPCDIEHSSVFDHQNLLESLRKKETAFWKSEK
jgi:hypothetical protein